MSSSPTKHVESANVDSSSHHPSPKKKQRVNPSDQVDWSESASNSRFKLQDAWANIIQRHEAIHSACQFGAGRTRAMREEEDDIIDLGTLEIVQDRGVLQGSRKGNWAIGRSIVQAPLMKDWAENPKESEESDSCPWEDASDPSEDELGVWEDLPSQQNPIHKARQKKLHLERKALEEFLSKEQINKGCSSSPPPVVGSTDYLTQGSSSEEEFGVNAEHHTGGLERKKPIKQYYAKRPTLQVVFPKYSITSNSKSKPSNHADTDNELQPAIAYSARSGLTPIIQEKLTLKTKVKRKAMFLSLDSPHKSTTPAKFPTKQNKTLEELNWTPRALPSVNHLDKHFQGLVASLATPTKTERLGSHSPLGSHFRTLQKNPFYRELLSRNLPSASLTAALTASEENVSPRKRRHSTLDDSEDVESSPIPSSPCPSPTKPPANLFLGDEYLAEELDILSFKPATWATIKQEEI